MNSVTDLNEYRAERKALRRASLIDDMIGLFAVLGMVIVFCLVLLLEAIFS